MRRERVMGILILLLFLTSVVVGASRLIKSPAITPSRFPTPGRGSLAIVTIYGPIGIKDTSLFPFAPRGVDYIVQRLEELSRYPQLKGIILRINSPGGTVGGVQEIYTQILKLKNKGVKVVSSLGEIATSGAYYIASASDLIVANPGTITGSIGVFVPITSLKGLFEKVGIKVEIIKSAKFKDIGSSSHLLTEEEKEILQSLVDNAHQQFIEVLKAGRKGKIKEEELEKIADGRIMTGEQAKEMGLVDVLGNFQDAIQWAKDLAGIKGKPVIIKERRGWERFLVKLEEKWEGTPFYFLFRSPEPILEYRYYPQNL